MSYGFVNNFEQILASPASDTDTTFTLDGGGSLISDASAGKVYVLTLYATDANGNETKREIIHVTAVSGDVLTVARAKEGTTAQAWAAGDGVSQRLTAGALGGFLVASRPFIAGPGVYSTNVDAASMIYGVDVGGSGDPAHVNVVMGSNCEAGGNNGVVVGYNCYPVGDDVIVFGIGNYAYASGLYLGSNHYGDSAGAIAIGDSVSIYGAAGTGIGMSASVNAAGAIAIGELASADIAGGLHVAGLSYLPASPTVSGITGPEIAHRTAHQVVVATASLDLTNGAAVVSLDLPSGTQLFIDSIDVVISGSDTPGGSPEIQVGTDAGTPADLLASTVVGKTAVGGRETHAPLITDGVTTVRAEVTTAGTGTTYEAKVVFRGYVMEL